MSMVNEIAEMIFRFFSDEKIHTSQEYREMAIEKGIITEDNNTAVSNTIFRIKDDPRFEVIDKGQYIVHRSNPAEEIMTVENAFNYLDKRIELLQLLNVVSNSEEEIQIGLDEKKMFIKYLSKFSKILNLK